MLTVEIRVNGSIISAMSVIRKGYVKGDDSLFSYEYQGVSFPANSEGEVRPWHGKLTHKYDDGAEVLVKKLFEAITSNHRSK